MNDPLRRIANVLRPAMSAHERADIKESARLLGIEITWTDDDVYTLAQRAFGRMLITRPRQTST